MAYSDPNSAFDHLHTETSEALASHFPIVGKKYTVRLSGTTLGQRLDPNDIRSQYQKRVDGGSYSVPLYGNLQLVENETGKVMEERKLHLLDLPQMTNRFSYIVGGKEYQVANQWQSRAGAYTKRGQNGELSTRFNVLNRNQFDLTFHPETSNVEMEVKSARIPVYPLLKALGASDSEIEKRVGKVAFESMRDARGVGSALRQFYKTTTRKDAESDEAAHAHFVDQMKESVMDPQVTKHTLGAEMSHVTADTLLRSIEKLQKVHGGAPEDDKDSLVFKGLRSIGDFAGDKIRAHGKAVRERVGRQLTSGTTLRRIIPPGLFNAPLRETFTDNAASELAAQINPVEMIGKNFQTTVLGPGGITSEDKILDSVKLINRSHLGFQDTVVTPESGRTGVNLRLPLGLQKVGKDAKISVYNLRTGAPEMVDTGTFLTSHVVLPDQVSWKNGTPVPVAADVKVAGKDNEIEVMPFHKAHYVMRHPSQVFSTTTNLIPFLANVSGNRASMATRHIEQAISLTDREPPLVQAASGHPNPHLRTFHDVIGRQSAHISPFNGKVVAVKPDGIHIQTEAGLKEVQIYNHFPLNDAKSTLHSTPVVKVGDEVTKGQLLADTNYTKNGTLALGKNLRVAYLPFRGLNFEDGVVVSETAAKKLTSNHMYKDQLTVTPETILDKKKFMYHVGGGYRKDQVENIGDDGVVRVGSKLRPGDPMVLAMSPYDLKSRMDARSINRALTGAHNDKSLRWHGDVEGEVVSVHRSKDGVHVHVKTTEAARVGDKLSSANANKGVISMIVPDHMMPHTPDGSPIEVALNPCYDDKTEFLTRRGWVRGPELVNEDIFATINPMTLRLEYQRPVQGVYRWRYTGKMYRLKNAQLDLCVTPNHKNFVAKRVPGALGPIDLGSVPPGTFQLEEAQAGFGQPRRHLKAAAWEGTPVHTVHVPAGSQCATGPKNQPLNLSESDYAELMGWYLSEGYCQKTKSGGYVVAISQSRTANSEKYERIVALLTRIGLSPILGDEDIRVHHKGLFELLKPLGYQHERFIPESVQSLPAASLRVFLDAYLMGDGSRRDRPSDGHHGTMRFSTTSRALADGIQLVAFKLGMVVNVHPPKVRMRSQMERPCYELSIGARHRAPWANWSEETKKNQTEEWVDYDGTVYCTEVPNGVLVVRRNGKVVISGNSGVPGRMNPSQLLETAASKIALKTGKTFIVPNFKHGYDAVAHVQSELEKHGLTDTEELIDPVSKQSLGKVMVGHQHILKLVHQSDKKIGVASGMTLPGVPSDEKYDANLQPKGGSRLGSLGTYALLAHGAVHNLREFQTFKGEGEDREADGSKRWPSQHVDVWNAIQTGAPLPLPKSSFAFHKFTEMLKGSGINVEKKGHEIIASPLTDAHVLELAGNRVLPKPGDIVNAKIDKATGELQPRPGGLFDVKLTGGHNGKKWSRIELHEPMPNPIFEGPIRALTGLSAEHFHGIISGTHGVSASGKVTPVKDAVHHGGHAIAHLLKGIDVKKELEATTQALNNAPPSKVDGILKKAKYLRALDGLGLNPHDAYIMKNVAVIPPAFRPVSVLGDGKNINVGDVNRIYRDVGILNERMGHSALDQAPEVKAAVRKDLYESIRQISGDGIPYADAKHKGLLHLLAGPAPKQGFIQKRLTQKRQDLSLTAVITPEPALHLDQVGLPRDKALELFRPFVVQKLQEMGYAKHPLEARAVLAKAGPESFAALEKVVADRPVLIKRDPALHKYSVQGFDVKLVEGNTMKLHPLVCGGFTADFDGDSALGEVIVVAAGGDVYQGDLKGFHMPHMGDVASARVVDLADFPRIEGTARTNSRGVVEYDVPSGTYVPAFHEGRMQMMAVSEYSVHPNCREWKVTTHRGRELLCSENHSLAVLDPDTLEVVKKSPRDAEGLGIPVLRDLGETTATWALPGVKATHHRVKPMVGEVHLDRAVGWFLGATLGDGWVSDLSRGPTQQGRFTGKLKERSECKSRQVCLSYGKGEASVAVAAQWAKVAESLVSDSTCGVAHLPHEFEGKPCTSYRLTLANTSLGMWVEELIGTGAERKHLPADFLTYPLECRRGLFCGLMDTDGTVNWVTAKSKSTPQFQCSITTISQELADGLQLLAGSVGVVSNRTVYTNRGKPVYLVSFSTRSMQDAGWVELIHTGKQANLSKLWATAGVMHGRGDVVPMPPRALEELLEHLRALGAAKKDKDDSEKSAFATYAALKRTTQYVTRTMVEKLQGQLQGRELSGYLSKWLQLATNASLGWDIVTSAAATGETKTMYDLTVPDAWTFTMANGAVVWDTMRAYVPISKEAVQEAHRMKPSQNLFAESTGQIMYVPSLDSALGLYKMSLPGAKTDHKFTSTQDILAAAKSGKMGPRDIVQLNGKPTTAARVLLADALPEAMRPKMLHGVDDHINGSRLRDLYTEIGKSHKAEFAKSADALKDIGNHAAFGTVPIPNSKDYLTIGAHSLSLADMKTLAEVRDPVVNAAHHDVAEIRKKFGKTPDADAKVVARYKEAEKQLRAHIAAIPHEKGNNLHTMYLAGVKPGWDQYKQLIFGPMLLEDSTGKTITTPVTRSYSEGLDVAGYWTQMHGARKGSVQKVQEVSEPGALTKLIMQSTLNTVVAAPDCGTSRGVLLPVSGAASDVHDRVLARDFSHGGLHVPAGTTLDPRVVDKIRAASPTAQVLVRSPLRCEHGNGVCQKCAGLSPNGHHHPLGTNIGVIASQTVGERAVQLMLKSFHSGGTASIGGGPTLIGGFKRLEQLTTLPEKVPNQATLAMRSGTISKIEHKPTGVDVYVDGHKHFVGKDPSGQELHKPHAGSQWTGLAVGQTVKAGDHLSDPTRSIVNPRDLYKATGSIEVVQNHLADEMHKLYASENVKRRHLETVVRGLTSVTKVVDPGGASGILRGEFKPLASVHSLNKELQKAGRPLIEHTPTLRGVETVPHDMQDDWIAKLQHRRIIDTLTGAAALGSKANIHGTHPITGLAYGARFGLTKRHSAQPGLHDHKDVPEHYY